MNYMGFKQKVLAPQNPAPSNEIQVVKASDVETRGLSRVDPPVELGSLRVAKDTARAASVGRMVTSSPRLWISCPVWKETSLEDASARDISHDSGAAREGSSISLAAARGQRPGPEQTGGRVAGSWLGPSWCISPPCRDLGDIGNTTPWWAEAPSDWDRGAWEDIPAQPGNLGSDGCGAHHIPSHAAFTNLPGAARVKNITARNLRYISSLFTSAFNEALFCNTES